MNEKIVTDASLVDGGATSNLSHADFTAHERRGNTDFSISLATALLAVVLGVAAGILFAL